MRFWWSPLAFAKRLFVNRAHTTPNLPSLPNMNRPTNYSAFFRLPVELRFQILSYLRPDDLLRFVLAAYTQLRQVGHVPSLTTRTFRGLTQPRPRDPAPAWRLPMELTDEILGYCHNPRDVLRFCFLHRAVLFEYIREDLDAETIEGLRRAIEDLNPDVL